MRRPDRPTCLPDPCVLVPPLSPNAYRLIPDLTDREAPSNIKSPLVNKSVDRESSARRAEPPFRANAWGGAWLPDTDAVGEADTMWPSRRLGSKKWVDKVGQR